MTGISVMLPVYNGLPYLKESVESVLQQDHGEIEFLVLDDCSTDGSWEYLQSLQDSRLMLWRNEKNMGLFYNLNWLAKQARFDLLKLWSQDDIMYPNALGTIARFHEKHPEIGFSYTGVEVIDEEGKVIETDWVDPTPEIIDRALHTKIAFRTGSIAGNIANVTLTRKALQKVHLFSVTMKIAADTEMLFKIAEHFPVGFIREKIIRLRRHKGQLSRQEQYYINHLREELQCYRFLMSYVSPDEKKAGIEELRKRKLQFYMTLMAKAFARRDFETGKAFWKELSAFDRMPVLLKNFVRYKIFKKPLGEDLFA